MQCQLNTGTANTLTINYKSTEKQAKSIIFTEKNCSYNDTYISYWYSCNLLESFKINLDKCM